MKNLKVFISLLSAGLFFAGSAFADYPTEVNKRPLTLPGGAWSAGVGLDLTNKFESVGMTFSGAYAVNDTLQVGVACDQPITDFALSKDLTLGANYGVINDGALRLAPSLSLPLSFAEGSDVLPSMTVGVDGRYNLMNDQLALYFGHGFFTYDLTGKSWGIGLPLGIGYQIDANINARIDTTLANINEAATTSIADATPLRVSVVYAMSSKMDVGVSVAMADLQNKPGDSLAVGLAFAYRGF